MGEGKREVCVRRAITSLRLNSQALRKGERVNDGIKGKLALRGFP
jgi:hypothetical protein